MLILNVDKLISALLVIKFLTVVLRTYKLEDGKKEEET